MSQPALSHPVATRYTTFRGSIRSVRTCQPDLPAPALHRQFARPRVLVAAIPPAMRGGSRWFRLPATGAWVGHFAFEKNRRPSSVSRSTASATGDVLGHPADALRLNAGAPAGVRSTFGRGPRFFGTQPRPPGGRWRRVRSMALARSRPGPSTSAMNRRSGAARTPSSRSPGCAQRGPRRRRARSCRNAREHRSGERLPNSALTGAASTIRRPARQARDASCVPSAKTRMSRCRGRTPAGRRSSCGENTSGTPNLDTEGVDPQSSVLVSTDSIRSRCRYWRASQPPVAAQPTATRRCHRQRRMFGKRVETFLPSC